MISAYSALIMLLTFGRAHAGPCPAIGPGAPEAAFQVRPDAPLQLILELKVRTPAELDAAAPLLAAAAGAGLPLWIRVRPADAGALASALPAASRAGHALVADLSGGDAPPAADLPGWRAALRAARRAVAEAGAAPVAAIALGWAPPAAEVAADELGLRVVLVDDASGGAPRPARLADGTAGRARLVPTADPGDGCGPQLPHPTPSALDRAARGAGAAAGPVRVGLPLELPPALLRRWADEVLRPTGAVALSPRGAAAAVPRRVALLGRPMAEPPPPPPPPGRALPVGDLDEAARALAGVTRLPRALPGGVTLTEAFAGLVLITADPDAPLLLPRLAPPLESPIRTLSSPLPLDPEALRAAARALAPSLQGSVPGLIDVGGHTLTPGELLVALADLRRGEPPVARPVGDPDPYAPGAGWGRSGGP